MLCKLIKECKSLVKLNLAVNSFNEQMGWTVLEEMRGNRSLQEFDVRNANLSATTTMLIDELVNRNCISFQEIAESEDEFNIARS